MITSPSIDDLIESAVLAIGADILPHLANDKAIASAAMIQSVLTGVRQLLPVYDNLIVEEHNAMTQVLRDAAALVEDVDGEAADRIRQRAASLGAAPDLAAMPDCEAQRSAHRRLSTSLGETMTDLDELQRADVAGSDEALNVVRAHLSMRLPRYAGAISIEGGMLGRG